MKNQCNNKKVEIIAAAVIKKFKEMNVPLEKSKKENNYISLFSPIMISVVDCQVLIGIDTKKEIIGINIQYKKQLEENDIPIMVEFANYYNKLYSTVGYATFDPENTIIQFKAGVELFPGKIDTNHLEACYNSIYSDAIKYFAFIESAKDSGYSAKELMSKFCGYKTDIPSAVEAKMN